MKKTKRILGIDLARSLIIIDMIFGNFKVFIGSNGEGLINELYPYIGKTIPSFIVLAGVGISLMSKPIIEEKHSNKLKAVKNTLLKRAGVLFLAGLAFIFLWPADILHYYGVYMFICLFFLTAHRSVLLLLSGAFIIAFPVLYLLIDYKTGWGFSSLSYVDFWTLEGFMRHLFYNGYHPVFPWTALMLFGMWLGRLDLGDPKIVRKGFITGLISFLLIQLFSHLTYYKYPEYRDWLDTTLMPPLPLYMLHGMAVATTIIMGSLLVGKHYAQSRIVKALQNAGKLSLTIYIAHIVLGMGVIYYWNQEMIGEYAFKFSMMYGLLFTVLSILFANVWLRTKKTGPLEWLLRKIAG